LAQNIHEVKNDKQKKKNLGTLFHKTQDTLTMKVWEGRGGGGVTTSYMNFLAQLVTARLKATSVLYGIVQFSRFQ
jgi:hypothetical protein